MNSSAKTEYKWDEINWRKLKLCVFKLQKQIYRASKSGNLKKVRSLQRLLLKSKSAKLLAVRRVTQENDGKKTAGIDGVKSLTPTQRLKLADTLKLEGKSKPVRRIWIPKPGKTEKRPLGIPVMADRARQALAKLALEPEWEEKFEPNSYGFRPGRSTQDAIEAIYKAISKKNAYVLDADISGCFDNIDHQALLRKTNTSPKLRRVIKTWLKAGIMEGTVFHKSHRGTPQGGIISPLLANIALHGMEYETKEALYKDVRRLHRQEYKKTSIKLLMRTISIVRYADDFVVIHRDLEIVEKAKEFIKEWLKKAGLLFNESKTKIVHTLNTFRGEKPGFDFLGLQVRQYKDRRTVSGYKTLTKPSVGSCKRHQESIKQIIKLRIASTQEEVIRNLNPKIRGWSNYYSSSVASKIFNRIDDLVFHWLWKCARWRHQNKGLKWIKNKYFRGDGCNNWRFCDKTVKLNLHSDVKIRRHIKIQGTKSCFDGDAEYWNNRAKNMKRCA
jgi:RNA-directed DNA polymerase